MAVWRWKSGRKSLKSQMLYTFSGQPSTIQSPRPRVLGLLSFEQGLGLNGGSFIVDSRSFLAPSVQFLDLLGDCA